MAGGVASALNVLFLVGFPVSFLGRMEGGVPEFLYGVPAMSAALLSIPPVTALLSVGALIAVVGMWRDRRTSRGARLGHTLVACALLSFVLFAWFWRVMTLSA
ncbi:MAG: hypothetical protein ACRD2N_10895 [Vicinamibacterales bacterium]